MKVVDIKIVLHIRRVLVNVLYKCEKREEVIIKQEKNMLNYIKENHLNKIKREKQKTNEQNKHSQWLERQAKTNVPRTKKQTSVNYKCRDWNNVKKIKWNKT